MRISAKTGEGVTALLYQIEEALRENKIFIEKVFRYAEANQLAPIRKYGQIIKEEYREDGIFVSAYVPKELSYISGIK